MSEYSSPANPKPPSVDRLSLLWRRVNEHKIVQWSVAYVAIAYAIQHGVTLTSEAFEWPNAVARISMLLLILGLPVVMTLAWYHGARASRRISGPELTIISILLVIGSLFFYVVVRPSEQTAAGTAPPVRPASVAPGAPSPAAPGGISIAVLPFVNLSSDKEQEFFSDGMTEEITAALAKVPDLRVVARTSAFEFKGKNVNIKTMGEQLGATHLIEGSVRKAGNRLRITAQLIKSDDGTHLWAEDYDRELTDVFAIQEDIAQAIAGALRVPLGLQPGDTLIRNRTTAGAYEDYLRARAMTRFRDLKSVTDSAALLEQIVARDPNYAPAWAHLGQVYATIPTLERGGTSIQENRDAARASLAKAEAAAQRAIQLDPKLPTAYVPLSEVESFRGNLLRQEELLTQALALDPNNVDVLDSYSQFLAAVGRLKEALAMRQRMQVLEPFVPLLNRITAQVLSLNGQDEAAIAMLKALPPGAGEATLASLYARMGRYREAADQLMAVPRGVFPPEMVEEAARLLRLAPAAAKPVRPLESVDGSNLAYVYLYAGDPMRAFEFFENAAEAGAANAGSTFAGLWASSFAPVRKTERFRALMRQTGFVAYWRAKGWPPQCHPVGADDFACN